ncbi:hypothetical protein CDL12_09905 [Handroanthus impetiginosus]|uniref:Uncharacterized protein n=1 Tax=Handroanthus impetiginosus TaxID=429701 RepID=A0A2G9HIT8_9LAMI|nr:hypothetical protein CDL12_09905 [Handroanthus impetiginosus]
MICHVPSPTPFMNHQVQLRSSNQEMHTLYGRKNIKHFFQRFQPQIIPLQHFHQPFLLQGQSCLNSAIVSFHLPRPPMQNETTGPSLSRPPSLAVLLASQLSTSPSLLFPSATYPPSPSALPIDRLSPLYSLALGPRAPPQAEDQTLSRASEKLHSAANRQPRGTRPRGYSSMTG